MRFDRILIADWSAAGRPTSAVRLADSIWIGEAGGPQHHFRTRHAAEVWLRARLADWSGQRVLLGFDFAFAYPAGFARALTGRDDPRAVWRWLAENLTDTVDNANNRFALAERINRLFPSGPGPFWSRPVSHDLPDLPRRRHGIDYAGHGLTERRQAETLTRAKPVWMLTNPGAVGSQSLVGQALLSRLDRPGKAGRRASGAGRGLSFAAGPPCHAAHARGRGEGQRAGAPFGAGFGGTGPAGSTG